MKKSILIFTCMIFVAVSACFAVTSASGYNDTNTKSAQTVVTLKMDGNPEDSQEVIQLYFTATDPSAQPTPPTPAPSVALGFNGDTTAENNNPLYVWWKIVSGSNYDIQLGITEQLANTNNKEQKIHWDASWKDPVEEGAETLTADDNTVSSENTEDFETITTHNGGNRLTSIGSRQITITTEDVSGVDGLTAGNYQAYLTLQIVADATGQAG